MTTLADRIDAAQEHLQADLAGADLRTHDQRVADEMADLCRRVLVLEALVRLSLGLTTRDEPAVEGD